MKVFRSPNFTRLLLIWFCNWPGAIEGHTLLLTRDLLVGLVHAGEQPLKRRVNVEANLPIAQRCLKVALELDTAPEGFFSFKGSALFCRLFGSAQTIKKFNEEITKVESPLYKNEKRESTYCWGIGTVMNICNHEMARVNNFILFSSL